MVRPLDENDLRALIGLLATLEGHLMAGDVDPFMAQSLARRLHDDGAATTADPGRPLRQGINDLNHRLRFALGEYEVPPESAPVPD